MENGVSPVSCPVCTLYMREGVTLQSHLDTHPKDQVIAALVRVSGGSSPSTRESQNDETTSTPMLEIAPGSQDSISGSQCIPPSSSHFTTAITYQQFLSSNGSASNTVIPQYVSMPAVLSAPNSGQSATNQAAFMQMMYNPYVIQQQQQQFQLLSSVTSPSHQQPFIRHMVPSYSQPQMNLASSSVPYQASGFPADYSQQGFQNASNAIPSSLPLPTSSSSSSFTPSTLSCSVSSAVSAGTTIPTVFSLSSTREQAANQDEQVTLNKSNSPPSDEHRNVSCPISISNGIVQCSKQQLGEETVMLDVPAEDSFSDRNLPDGESAAYSSIDTGVATQTSGMHYEDDDQKRPCVAKDEESYTEEQAAVIEDAGSILQLESPRSESVNVRVRKDLNDVAVSPMVRSYDSGSDENTDSEYVDMRNEDMSQISGIIRSALRIQPPPISVIDNDEYITSDRQFSGQSESNKDEASVKEMPDNCEKPDEENEESANKFLDLDSSEPVNIIEIDGIRILVPSEFLENSSSVLGNKLPVDSLSVSPEEENQQPSETEPEAIMVPTLNIQTDETMPPRGELSEQESIGGNDSSMWVQAFQEKEVSTSYDLLARETWEASDGSDADIILDSEATPPVVEKQAKCGTSSQVRRKARSRIFKCGTCGEPFNCPKERRVHKSTYHSDKMADGEGVASASGCKDSSEVVPRRQVHKRKARIKKVIKEEDDDDKSCVKTEEPQFMGVFIEEDTETKMEAEDGSEEGGESLENVSVAVEKEEAKEVPKREQPAEAAATFPCSMCVEIFTSPKLRTSHERKAHNISKDKKNVCATCKKVFTTDSQYHTHLQTHPLECSQCGKYFYRRQNLDLHLKRHLGIKPHKCTICDKAFVTKQKLVEHTNSHTGNAPIKCPFCDEMFRRYSNLIQHKHRYHMNLKKKVKDFFCHCGEIFHSKKKLEWHKEIHEEKPKCCTYCSERFVHASSLTRHIRKAHDCRYVPKCGREVENVECKVCGYVFLKSSLPVHMRMHSGERPHSCHVCGKDFTTKWNLQLHRWTHAARSTKPFKCSLCKSAFFRRNDYTAHMHSHRNVRPYTCNHCGCQFIRKYNCLRHVREHEVGKSFSCNICGKMFHRSYYLKEHMRVHSGARPFACHICGKASSTKSNHNKHVKIHHAREPVNTEG